MTDEERQEIVRNLRNYHPSRVGNWTFTRAANEIERLAAELANANRLLEIGRRRSLEKSGGLEIGNND